jgi:glycerophosphoryl diester phosphodiesterase
MNRPILYAHRGAASVEPENTLPSFHRGLELGADALELDVHMTSDGHIVVSHDPDGRRMCRAPVPFRGATLAEVVRWDAGWGFVASDGGRPFAGKGYRVPTLEQMLVEFSGVQLNVDAKQRDPDLVEPLLVLLRRHRAEDRVLLNSFSTRTLARIRRLGWEGRTGMSRGDVLLFLCGVRRGDAAQVPLKAGPIRFASREFIDRCHRHGVAAEFWTVNDPAVARELLELGADGIMTDDPGAIAKVFRPYRT